MAILRFNHVGMTAIAACVPSRVVSNYEMESFLSKEAVEKLVNAVGIKEKRFADSDVCSSDLCYKAAKKLMEDNNIAPESIDMLLFLSLTPDYIVPPTSSILQHRLGLPKTTGALDLSLACSGFVYALSTAFAYASVPGVNRVLLLVGETMSKLTNPRDKVNAPLYGDAGTAALIEKGDFEEAVFNLVADGEGENYVKIPVGGFRHPVTADSLLEKEREEGNIRRDVDITMDGIGVFNHAVSMIPKGIRETMATAQIVADDIDYMVFHQANKFMLDFIVKRLKFNPDKVPFCISKYGNTSCASVPLTIVSELQGKLEGRKRLLLSAIGAGWSLGTAYMVTKDCNVSEIIEY